MSYLYLAAAISLEVIGTMLLPLSKNFTQPLPSAGIILCYVTAFYLLTHAIKTIPIAIAYATWSGAGIFAIAILSYILFAQSLQWQAVAGLAFIVVGVALVNGYSSLH